MNTTLFDLMDLDISALVSQNKTEIKKKEKIAVKTEKANKSTVIKLDLSKEITLITGFHEVTNINLNHLVNEELTDSKLYGEIGKVFDEYSLLTSKYVVLPNNKLLLYFDIDAVVSDVDINPHEEWKIILGNKRVSSKDYAVNNLSSLFSYWSEETILFDPLKFVVDRMHKVAIPVVGDRVSQVPHDTEVYLWDTGSFSRNIVLDSELFEAEDDSLELELDEFKDNLQDIKELVQFDSNYIILKNSLNNYFIWPFSCSNDVKPISKANKSINTYPTENTTLSLAFTRFDLDPSMFNGKKKITADDLINFLKEDYPEFSKERTSFIYDKGNNMILACLTGSRKGLLQEEVESSHNITRHTLTNGTSIRMEKNEIGYFAASNKNEGEFQMYLPPIGENILREIHGFFYSVIQYGIIHKGVYLEAACQLFYDKKYKKYFIHYPKQECSYSSVSMFRNPGLEHNKNMILVMDIHSHHVMKARFSSIDDEDEKGTRLYGVMGSINRDGYQFSLRAGTGGYFIPLDYKQYVIEESPVNFKNTTSYNSAYFKKLITVVDTVELSNIK